MNEKQESPSQTAVTVVTTDTGSQSKKTTTKSVAEATATSGGKKKKGKKSPEDLEEPPLFFRNDQSAKGGASNVTDMDKSMAKMYKDLQQKMEKLKQEVADKDAHIAKLEELLKTKTMLDGFGSEDSKSSQAQMVHKPCISSNLQTTTHSLSFFARHFIL